MLRMSSFSGMDARALLRARFGHRRRRCQPRMTLEQPIESARREGAFAPPVRQTFRVDDEGPCLTDGIVRAEVLEEATRRRAAMICDDDAIKGPLLGAGARESNVYGHG